MGIRSQVHAETQSRRGQHFYYEQRLDALLGKLPNNDLPGQPEQDRRRD